MPVASPSSKGCQWPLCPMRWGSLVLPSGQGRFADTEIMGALRCWSAKFLRNVYEMDRTEDWERCLLAEADQQLRCVSHLLVPTSAAVADARIALAASRLCGEQGVLIRATLHCDKALKLPLPASPGRPYSAEEKTRMLEEAQKLGTPQMHAALALDLNTGLWDKELREIRWEQIDLVHKKALTVGKSKTEAGTGRVIPLNETAIAAP